MVCFCLQPDVLRFPVEVTTSQLSRTTGLSCPPVFPLLAVLLLYRSHLMCNQCNKVKRTFGRLGSVDANVFVVHANRDVIKKGKHQDKKTLLDEITTPASALRNTSGGLLVVHLKGQFPEDRSLEYFDEFISGSLNNLISNGTLYVHVYKRAWLNLKTGFQEFSDFVAIRIEQDNSNVATVTFNTKIRSDFETRDPSILNLVSLLTNKPRNSQSVPQIRGLPVHTSKQFECRNCEFKAFQPMPEKVNEINEGKLDIVEYLWSDLKLRDNITSFTKVPDGGSLYVGISEKLDTTTKSKYPVITGFQLENTYEPEAWGVISVSDHQFKLRINRSQLERKIFDKLSELTLLNLNGEFINPPNDMIKVTFHKVEGRSADLHVLEVSVCYLDGVLFFDNGPRSHVVDTRQRPNKCKRMTNDEWLDRLFRRCVGCGQQWGYFNK
ncbi:uncharacterized protein LOC124260918 isoform X1 [Haliotis rubra]|uniref:uncharacterized protein LOC124260918 isoform X1 n=1 Tax=Haliotis rubra TaxID=36100 RepID=UPI001EE51D48|nr:uncharacterized protein LOC124260918 isoform X1 [Haliotis rubra]